MTDKLKGDSGIRLQKELAMGQKTTLGGAPAKPETPRFKGGGAVRETQGRFRGTPKK